MSKQQDPHRQLLDLLQQVMAVAQTLVTPLPATRRSNATKSKHAGIYPHTSKYNPWRAFVWDANKKRSVYIGAFPSVARAKAAQQDYRDGRPLASGTKSHAPLRVVQALRRAA